MKTLIRPLLASLNQYGSYVYKEPDFRVDHLVIGAGVVGLAVANALARRWPEKSTYVIERHPQFGQETSSRNSEVIHAGLYYPADSLKTRFCLRGRELLYDRVQRGGIEAKKIGKLVVGGVNDAAYLQKLHMHCASLGEHGPPTRLLSGDEARELEPDLSRDIVHALHSPETGIVSVHDLMAQLANELSEMPGADEVPDAQIVYGTSVVRIDPHLPSTSASSKRGTDLSQEGWVAQLRTHDASHSETDALLARVVINATGLNAPRVLNTLLQARGVPSSEWVPMYFAKGSYASYRGPGTSHVRHLLYPTPQFGASPSTRQPHAVHSLGTHLTLDLDGHVRFGPDLTWLTPPTTMQEEDAVGYAHDFWETQLSPEPTDAWFDSMERAIQAYLPGVRRERLAADYAGIRPKLQGPESTTFQDFELVWHTSRGLGQQPVWQRTLPSEAPSAGVLLNMLGIESPGVTSALALGEYVVTQLAEGVWGPTNPRGKARAYVDDVGDASLAQWA